MKRLLLDAHTLIWWDMASPELGRRARQTIQDAEAVFVSAATEWELSIKAALGKLSLSRSILEAVEDAGFIPLPVSFKHAHQVRSLKPIHRDPFDRILVAVALSESLTLVSADSIVQKYRVSVLNARE